MAAMRNVAAAFWSNSRRRVRTATCEYIPSKSGGGMIVDYGWAVLATRTRRGRVTIYEGWRHYSTTTSKHMSQLGLYATGPNVRRIKKRRTLGGGFGRLY